MAPRSTASDPDPKDSPEAWISITHPSSKDEEPGRVQRHAFEDVWKAKGWSEVKDSASFDAVPSGEVTNPTT
jgi:hypothetical protein